MEDNATIHVTTFTWAYKKAPKTSYNSIDDWISTTSLNSFLYIPIMLFSLFTSMFSWITAGSTTGFYKYETRLTGYVGPINSMAVCARGTLLATGGTSSTNLKVILVPWWFNELGYDGVVLWNLRRLARLVTPSLQDLHGAVTCVVWLTGSADINQVLAFTTSAGYVFVWKQASTRVSILYTYSYSFLLWHERRAYLRQSPMQE